jgi:hypothetical protein
VTRPYATVCVAIAARGWPRYGEHMPNPLRSCVLATLALLLCACSTADLPDRIAPPQESFLGYLRGLCGQAFAGRVTVDTPPSTPDPFAGKPLLMHVRECGADTLRIPFHVGDDRSRTWVLSLPTDGPALRLKHDHRHADGSADALTNYGGDSAATQLYTASRLRFAFPADAESKALFQRLDRAVSVDNVWALELDFATRRFTYELSRPGRLFRVEFDLSHPQPPPPPPWSVAPQQTH